MQLRHISPRSSDWMDAMDEGAGGRGWEKLAPEEREKLLKDRRDEDGDLTARRPEQQRRPGSGLRVGVAFQVGDEDFGRAILRAARVGRARHVVDDDREHERRVAG